MVPLGQLSSENSDILIIGFWLHHSLASCKLFLKLFGVKLVRGVVEYETLDLAILIRVRYGIQIKALAQQEPGKG